MLLISYQIATKMFLTTNLIFQSTNSSINHNVPSKNPLLPHQQQEQQQTNEITVPADNQNEHIDEAHPDRVIFRGGSNSASINSTNNTDQQNVGQGGYGNDDEEPIAQPTVPIHSKTKNWYSVFCNRYVSLFGAIIKIVIMMLVNSYYGATCIGVVFIVWFYVGTANPAVKPGLASEFQLFVWLKNLVFRCFG